MNSRDQKPGSKTSPKRSNSPGFGLRTSLDPLALAIRDRARAIREPKDLTPLIQEISQSRIVMLGEASHGTHEFYDWRRIISEWLIVKHGFRFIAVEGDWPPCWDLHQYINGNQTGTASDVLKSFNRWPTWMWANAETIRLAEWLRTHNGTVPARERVGFHGLDVYSLFESIDSVLKQLEKVDPLLAERARARYACFDPYDRDEIAYARSLIENPQGCEEDVLENLQELLHTRISGMQGTKNALFDATQNARVIRDAENYYRAVLLSDEESWNVRDRHMVDTLEVLLDHYGKDSKAIIWAHNTHIGDYRATDMLRRGEVNLGGLARERWGNDQVSLVGFGTYEGEVIASHAWDGPIEVKQVPRGRSDSLEGSLHLVSQSLGHGALYFSLRDEAAKRGPLVQPVGHRAIGVIFHPEYERHGNYVTTSLSNRYDAFIFVDRTTALEPLDQSFERKELPETWPRGY